MNNSNLPDSNVELLDCHTHNVHAERAIISVRPQQFNPQLNRWYSLSIHPWELENQNAPHPSKAFSLSEELNLCEELANHPQVLAIGECGLDKLTHAPLAFQMSILERQIQLSERIKKPLILHIVKAINELLTLRQELRPRQPWIIHGFRGKPQQTQQLLNHGLYLSYGEHYNADSLLLTPADRLLLESDMSRAPITLLYERAASLRGESSTQLQSTLQQTAKKLFFSA